MGSSTSQDLPCYKAVGYANNSLEAFTGASSSSGYVERLGRIPKPHEERDIHSLTKADISIQPYFIRVPLRERKQVKIGKKKRFVAKVGIVWKELPVLLPWEILNFLKRNGKLEQLMIPNPDEAVDFWNHFGSQSYTQRHHVQEMLRTGQDLKKAIAMHVTLTLASKYQKTTNPVRPPKYDTPTNPLRPLN